MVFDWLRDGLTFQFDDKSTLYINSTFAEFGGLGFAFNAEAPNKNTPTVSTVEAPGHWNGYLDKPINNVELILQSTRFKTDLIEYPQDLVMTLDDDSRITIISANFYDHTDTIADPGSEIIVCRGEQETKYFSLGKHRP